MNNGADKLAVLPFFSQLTVEQREAVSRVLDEHSVCPGEVIFEEGTPGLACAFIIAGTVHAELRVGPGKPRERINTMGAGEVFGEIALLDGGRRSASCIAGMDGARIALLTHQDFGLLFDAGNPFAFSMVRSITRQLARRMRQASRVWGQAVRSASGTSGTE